MKALLLGKLISALIGMLSPELLRSIFAALLNLISSAIEESKNKYDDKLLPLIDVIRTVVGILPDDED